MTSIWFSTERGSQKTIKNYKLPGNVYLLETHFSTIETESFFWIDLAVKNHIEINIKATHFMDQEDVVFINKTPLKMALHNH